MIQHRCLLTDSERWRRDLAKIDRRLDGQHGYFAPEQRERLWELREQLFIIGEITDLNRQLREIKMLGGES
jgi:hypothetical protein